MYTVKSLSIEGVWGYKNISFALNRNVNILIGNNGVGKTTVLNLLTAILNVDLSTLYKISFDKTIVEFIDEEQHQIIKLEIKRIGKSDKIIISYDFKGVNISKHNFNVTQLDNLESQGFGRYFLQRQISNVISFSWLSINRKNSESYLNEDDKESEIDRKLQTLMHGIQNYFYDLYTKSMNQNNQFKLDVINLFLYDKTIDAPDRKSLNEIRKDNIDAEELRKVFTSLGLQGKIFEERIKNHLIMIEKAKDEVVNAESKAEDSTGSLNESSNKVISLYLRTKQMLNTYHSFQEKDEANYELLNKYLKLLKKFMTNKSFSISDNTKGKLIVKSSQGSDLKIEELSSGEKQLIILLTEALLQRDEVYLYLADEPEMSLHLTWQEQILEAIIQLNNKAQIIVATHSPEIVQNWTSSIINLNEIN